MIREMTYKKALLRGLMGIPLGISVNMTAMLIISLAMGKMINYQTVISKNTLTAFAVNYMISIVVGFAFAIGTTTFEIEHWSLSRQTVAHFLLITTVFIPSAILGRWVRLNVVSILIYVCVFIVIYVISWIAQYNYWKMRIMKINEKLKK